MSADIYDGRTIVAGTDGQTAVVDHAGRVLSTGSYRDCLAVLEPRLAGAGYPADAAGRREGSGR